MCARRLLLRLPAAQSRSPRPQLRESALEQYKAQGDCTTRPSALRIVSIVRNREFALDALSTAERAPVSSLHSLDARVIDHRCHD